MLSTYTTQTYFKIRSKVGSHEVNYKPYKYKLSSVLIVYETSYYKPMIETRNVDFNLWRALRSTGRRPRALKLENQNSL